MRWLEIAALKRDIAQKIQELSDRDMRHWHPCAVIVWHRVIEFAVTQGTAGHLSESFWCKEQSFNTRFLRAGLPTPALMMRHVRMVLVAALLERGWGLTDIAYGLGWSSPQSMNRTMRGHMGMAAGEFRRRKPTLVSHLAVVMDALEVSSDRWSVFNPLELMALRAHEMGPVEKSNAA